MSRLSLFAVLLLLIVAFRADAAEPVAAEAAPAATATTDDAPAAAPPPAAVTVPIAAAVPPVAPATNASEYKLGTGDKLRIIVFGEMDLSGEYTVDSIGFIRLPLVGEVRAVGSTVAEIERQIVSVLREGYLRDPRVSVEVLTFRPFYIIGEVMMPGQYAYTTDMSVLNAVAVAGGYTYRANQSRVFIRRNGDTEEQAAPADQTTKIGPGDIIRVSERFF
jgi:polysaccharide export outer membrane protein